MVLKVFQTGVRGQLGLQLSEGLTEARGPTSKVAPSQVSCWVASVTFHMGLSIGFLEYLHDMAAGFPQNE